MMGMPVRYCVRSLYHRRARSMLTILGVAVAIFVSVMMLGLSRGLLHSTRGTASPGNVIVLSLGAESLEFSAIEPADFQRFQYDGSVAQKDGEPLASPEKLLSTFVHLPREHTSEEPGIVAGSNGYRGAVRGVLPVAFYVHEQVRLTDGKLPVEGYEVIVGRLTAAKLGVPDTALAIGQSISFEGEIWQIVGHFEAPGTLLESEIWARLDDVQTASRSRDYSAVVLKAQSPTAAEELVFELTTRTDVRLAAWSETDFFAAAADRLRPVSMVSIAVTAMLMFAATLAGMNTMFTSILGRTREMAILIVRGYKRLAVLTSFLLESVLLCLAGGVLGGLPALLLNDLPMRIPMGAFRFAIDGYVVGAGLLLSLVIGAVGAIVPLVNVARRPIVDALRSE